MRGLIEIVPHRPAWPEEFRLLGARLRKTLGERALAIHHIGSTAVPGLDAKDVVDLQVTLSSLDGLPAAALAGSGFGEIKLRDDHCPPGRTLPAAELAKLFANNDSLCRAANLHLRVRGRFNQRYPLLCRDYLRSHPQAAAAYAEVKRQLARRFPDDAGSYYAVKDPVFDILMEGAEAWAAATGWSEPPSDA